MKIYYISFVIMITIYFSNTYVYSMEQQGEYYSSSTSSYIYPCATTPSAQEDEQVEASAAPAAPRQSADDSNSPSGDVVIDMHAIAQQVQQEEQRPVNPLLQRSISRGIDAATHRARMLKRTKQAKKTAAIRETVANSDTSSALIMSTLITPAMLENLVTLVMNWDALSSSDRIAKITAIGGSVGCIVFAWIRKTIQQKKIANGAVDGEVTDDDGEDTMNEMIAAFGSVIQDALRQANPSLPTAPSDKKGK